MADEIKFEVGDTLGAEGIRLYICQDCKQIIPIPTEETPPYRYDYLLHAIEDKHGWQGHRFGVITVNRKGWDDDSSSGGREKIVAAIKQALRDNGSLLADGFGAEFYAVKETFKDDAMTCWKQHQRNPACSDYKSDSKRIQPDTAAERKAAGLEKYRSNQYLCMHCPVHSLVVTAQRKRAGLYK